MLLFRLPAAEAPLVFSTWRREPSFLVGDLDATDDLAAHGMIDKRCALTMNSAQKSGAGSSYTLLPIAIEEFNQFIEFLFLLRLIAALDRIDNTMIRVVFEDLTFNFVERSLDRTDLRQNIDTIALIFDHTRNAPHLPLDARQA